MHEHVSQIAGAPLELDGERLRWGGGNSALDVLIGTGPVPGPPTPAAQIGSSIPSASVLSAAPDNAVSNTSGGMTSLPRIQFAIGGVFVLAIAALVLLNRAGFKFSVTVG